MIKAIIFDLDNTLLDFVKMKRFAVRAAVTAMNEAGLGVDEKKAFDDIFDLYLNKGWEHQQVFDDYLHQHYYQTFHYYLLDKTLLVVLRFL